MFMLSAKIKAIAAAKTRIANLEQMIANDLNRELSCLPAMFGFTSTAAFTKALRRAARPTARAKRKRAKITDTTRSRVRQLVEAGKTGPEIAKLVRISLPSVQNIKRALGLVKSN